METSSIAILGKDLRQCYAAEYLHSLGWKVMCCHTPDFPYKSGIVWTDDLTKALGQSTFILAPTPLSRDNYHLSGIKMDAQPFTLDDLWDALVPSHKFIACGLPPEYRQILETIGCSVLDFGSDSFFREQNAALTAEGLLAEMIRCTPFSLSSANTLILGYGCCGAAICRLIRPLCSNICLIEQDTGKQEDAKKRGILPLGTDDLPDALAGCQIIVNTVPDTILNVGQLTQAHSSCHIFDIASAPFGFPADTTEQCLLPYHRLPGIPGRFSPVTAGGLIGRTIERMAEHVI